MAYSKISYEPSLIIIIIIIIKCFSKNVSKAASSSQDKVKLWIK